MDPPSEGGASPQEEAPDEHNPSLQGLGSRLRRGAQFAAIALIFTQLISLIQTVFVARLLTVEDRDGHNGGWNSAFDRLGDLLKTIHA